MIEEQLEESHGLCEYALYIQGACMHCGAESPPAGLVLRQRGQVQRSLEVFQAALQQSPASINILKQIARSLCGAAANACV